MHSPRFRFLGGCEQGFVAKPATLPDGTQDILNWEVVIPGKDGTLWEGARIPMTMQFSEDYPNKPPCELHC